MMSLYDENGACVVAEVVPSGPQTVVRYAARILAPEIFS